LLSYIILDIILEEKKIMEYIKTS